MKNKQSLKRKEIPLYMVTTLNAYQNTGRVVTVFPFIGKISLNGFPRISYGEAYQQMQATLNKNNTIITHRLHTHKCYIGTTSPTGMGNQIMPTGDISKAEAIS